MYDWNCGIELTYCKFHDGLWPHECGCDEAGLQDVCMDEEALKEIGE